MIFTEPHVLSFLTGMGTKNISEVTRVSSGWSAIAQKDITILKKVLQFIRRNENLKKIFVPKATQADDGPNRINPESEIIHGF